MNLGALGCFTLVSLFAVTEGIDLVSLFGCLVVFVGCCRFFVSVVVSYDLSLSELTSHISCEAPSSSQ